MNIFKDFSFEAIIDAIKNFKYQIDEIVQSDIKLDLDKNKKNQNERKTKSTRDKMPKVQ